MGVYASAYSVVVRNETVEIVYPGGMDAYIENVPNATFCTDGHVSRIGFMDYGATMAFIEQLIDLGFYAAPDGGQDIAVTQQEKGILSNTPWARFEIIADEPICYMAQKNPVPVAYPQHGPVEKLVYHEATDVGWLRFIGHEDRIDIWEDSRSGERQYAAVMQADVSPGIRGQRLDYITNRLYELSGEVERTRSCAADEVAARFTDELEALREEAERLEKTTGAHHGHALYCAGLANRLLERYSQAEVFYRTCLINHSENLSLLLELTLCLGEQERLDEVRAMALRSVEVAPDSAEAWGNLAGACLELKLRSEARDALDRALEIDPENTINLDMDKEFEAFFDNDSTAQAQSS